MSKTKREYLANVSRFGDLVGMRGLMAAVIAQATYDYVKGGRSKTFGDLAAHAELFLVSDDCRYMVEYLGWEYEWPWPVLKEFGE